MNIANKWKYVGLLYLLLFIVFVAGFLGGNDKSNHRQSVMTSLGDTAQQIDDFLLTRIQGENIEWEIGAKRATIVAGEEDAMLRDIIITHRPVSGGIITLVADKGKYNIDSNSFFMERADRDVSIKIGRGITINVSSLEWFDKDRQVRSSGPVQVAGQGFTLEGEDLVANLDNGIYEIKKNIRAAMW